MYTDLPLKTVYTIKKDSHKVSKVYKSYHFSVLIVFYNFSQLLLNIEVSQIHDLVYNLGFVTIRYCTQMSAKCWRVVITKIGQLDLQTLISL